MKLLALIILLLAFPSEVAAQSAFSVEGVELTCLGCKRRNSELCEIQSGLSVELVSCRELLGRGFRDGKDVWVAPGQHGAVLALAKRADTSERLRARAFEYLLGEEESAKEIVEHLLKKPKLAYAVYMAHRGAFRAHAPYFKEQLRGVFDEEALNRLRLVLLIDSGQLGLENIKDSLPRGNFELSEQVLTSYLEELKRRQEVTPKGLAAFRDDMKRCKATKEGGLCEESKDELVRELGRAQAVGVLTSKELSETSALALIHKLFSVGHITPQLLLATESLLKSLSEQQITVFREEYLHAEEALNGLAKSGPQVKVALAGHHLLAAERSVDKGEALQAALHYLSARGSIPDANPRMEVVLESLQSSSSPMVRELLDRAGLAPVSWGGVVGLILVSTFLALYFARRRDAFVSRVAPPSEELEEDERRELRRLQAYFELPIWADSMLLTNAYRTKAKALHPDTAGANADVSQFTELTDKYNRAKALLKKAA